MFRSSPNEDKLDPWCLEALAFWLFWLVDGLACAIFESKSD